MKMMNEFKDIDIVQIQALDVICSYDAFMF